MIKNLDKDKVQEFELISKYFNDIENSFSINENIKNCYLYDLKWILDHVDSSNKITIKRLNIINSELIQHIKGFTLLIRNQCNKQIKEEMIQSFIKQVEKNNLQLKELDYENNSY